VKGKSWRLRALASLRQKSSAGRELSRNRRAHGKIPGRVADCLRRLVGEDPAHAEEKFRARVQESAEKFLAQPQFALDPQQFRQAVESWTAAKLEKFRQALPVLTAGWG